MLKPLALGALVALTALADPAVAQEDVPRRIVVTGPAKSGPARHCRHLRRCGRSE